MRNPGEIKKLAYLRLSEAEILCNSGKYDGAFYLAGYSIELILKAKICEHLGIDSLFDEPRAEDMSGMSEIRRAVKTHDIRVLLIYSGLKNKLQNDKAEKEILMETYNYLIGTNDKNKEVCLWSEKSRYQSIGLQDEQSVKNFIDLLANEEGLLKWIVKS